VNPAGCHAKIFWRVILAHLFGGSFWRIYLVGHFGAFIWRVFIVNETSKLQSKEKKRKGMYNQ
jgi:hypothetical protein